MRGLIDELRHLTPSTYVHTLRLGKAALEWAAAKRMTQKAAIEIVAAVEGHDIGKQYMAKLIEYEGIYDDEQRELVSIHPILGGALYRSKEVKDRADEPTKSQVEAQMICHHMRHDDKFLVEIFSNLEGVEVDPYDLHTLVRTTDMLDASSNFYNRPYLRERLQKGELPFLHTSEGGSLRYIPPLLVNDICQAQALPLDQKVFGSTLEEMILEFAELLPPVAPAWIFESM